MKSLVLSLALVVCTFVSASSKNVQVLSVESLLDKAVTLAQKGDKSGTADVLTQSVSALEAEAKSSGGELKGKLLSKIGDLKALIPLASTGKLQSGTLGKVVSGVKMLLGANRISSLLGKGESGLLGKASSLTSNLQLIKAGSSLLGATNQTKLGGLINEATKVVGGVDKPGVAGKLAAAASSKQLGSIVSLVGSVL
jgi:hypothetical protein